MKKVYIHSGPAKTGTSAVQAWLLDNTDWLEQQGVWYPEHKMAQNSISSGNLDRVLDLDGKQKKVNADKVTALITALEQSKFDTLLLSSEFFFTHIESLSELIPSAQFIVYLRNPIDLLESGYNQRVKRHYGVGTFSAPKQISNGPWDRIGELLKVLSPGSLHVRPYGSAHFVGGSIISDLLSVLGLTKNIELPTINPSYTLPALELKRRLNSLPISSFQPLLDATLQSYTGGQSDYTFISNEEYTHLLNEPLKQLHSMIAEHRLEHLKSYHDSLSLGERGKSVVSTKNVSIEQLTLVADFIAEASPQLYKNVVMCLQQNTDLLIEDDHLFAAFKVPKGNSIVTGDQTLLACTEHLANSPFKRAKVMAELAKWHLEQGDLELAKEYAIVAYEVSPDSIQFRELYNRTVLLAREGADYKQHVSLKQKVVRKLKPLIRR